MATVPLWKKIGIEKPKDKEAPHNQYCNPLQDVTLSDGIILDLTKRQNEFTLIFSKSWTSLKSRTSEAQRI